MYPTGCSRICHVRSYHRPPHERMERGHGVGPELQVTKEPQRVERSGAISLMTYLMLLKFRAHDTPEKGPRSVFTRKRSFTSDRASADGAFCRATHAQTPPGA